jgi:ubiquinone/menaquinone biosynthesis C-methylase UbiE
MRVLDVGCGERKKIIGDAQVIGLDRVNLPGVDVVHDLNRFPWPFKDNEFDLVICDDVIEHLDDTIRVMAEIHRITKNHGIIKISVPHFTSDNYHTDITHKRAFTSRSFDFFDPDRSEVHQYYSRARFRIRKKVIGFSEVMPSGRKHPPNIHKFLGIQYLVNRFPRIYEKFFAYVMPATELYFELEVLKDQDE